VVREQRGDAGLLDDVAGTRHIALRTDRDPEDALDELIAARSRRSRADGPSDLRP
jgi:hypothetical protein